ncbi:MAG TPA: CHC2 zinc finger domain-containing protein, partial [Treponemataceae bacterium]|nr:CHC2 zinc finger domain-containing protein [Treponemataceae bacterium]
MGRISGETIDAVNKRSDIVSVVGEYTRLEKRGSDWWGCCPFHNEKSPSFHVIPERGMYHCFGCGKGGGIINFVMEMEKLSFVEAVESLAKKGGIEVIYEGGAPQADVPR